jgi:hypothetical protein
VVGGEAVAARFRFSPVPREDGLRTKRLYLPDRSLGENLVMIPDDANRDAGGAPTERRQAVVARRRDRIVA